MHAIHAARAAPAPPVLEVPEEGCGRKKAKHGTQHAAMLHVIRTLSASEECAYVELGAGKAGLSQALSEAQPRATYVLVDWAKPQNSADSSMRDRGLPPLDAHRLDAAVVGKVEAEAPVCAVVGIAKHLCGCATDFALHSIVSAATVPARENPALSGVVIATCCHHKCSWGTYCNRPFFEELGISAEDFQLLTVISSWATSGAADGGAGSGDRGGLGLNARDDAANA
eukprot:jgi/Chrpa1/13703/Chrysochromulina_OHIO_Genome00020858-RA